MVNRIDPSATESAALESRSTASSSASVSEHRTRRICVNSWLHLRPPPPRPRRPCRGGRADRGFIPAKPAEIFGYAGAVLSRHRITGCDRVLQHTNQSEEFVPVVAVELIEQIAQCSSREDLRFVHARGPVIEQAATSPHNGAAAIMPSAWLRERLRLSR